MSSDLVEEELPACDECGVIHAVDQPHAMVSCSDCGCEHVGQFDTCICEEGYCNECGCNDAPHQHCAGYDEGDHDCCECGAETQAPDLDDDYTQETFPGCLLCWQKYIGDGTWDPCNFGNAATANDDCAYFDMAAAAAYENPTGRDFSVIKPNMIMPPEDVKERQQHAVGMKLGLDLELSLSHAAADFYILERLYDDLHDRSYAYDARTKRHTLGGLRVPAEFGTGSKRERLAYEVANTRQQLNRELARQFEIYLIMAVGGELRHAPGEASRVMTKRGTPRSKWPRIKTRKPWRAWGLADVHKTYGCAACYEAKTKGWASYAQPCERTTTKQTIDGNGNIHTTKKVSPATQASLKCGYLTLWAEKHSIILPKKAMTRFKAHTTRLAEYFSPDLDRRERGLAWRNWLTLYTKYGPDLLKDCSDVFNKWMWTSGYGGDRWGSAAEFTAMYARREMSDSAFLDRCWTLEHNGGCIFNKFYRKGLPILPIVLDIQAKDEVHYPNLRRYASPYVKNLIELVYPSDKPVVRREVKVYANA